ncbi:hypothetical protein UFOVP770_23 [uncultured Caudovirales phage]|jgi:hypothetical protein|uniref:Holin of 3TMs, for gene-transfer release n=1 Tax=uncultured Caudovirales phage TaxID=2100421 RepID=A0A6J5NUL7_9CAUD|nr:hypothetical protein UFOVP770_23 [uncultured Caudovirales phage]
MTSLLSLILPALVPAFADGARGLIAKFTGGAGGQPQNIKERIELMKAESEKLQALAALDTPTGEPSKWIINLRASFRYIIISSIMIFTAIVVFNPDIVGATVVAVFLDMTGACMSFVIGERMYLAIKR